MLDICKEACTGCSACAAACPKSCITMQPDEEGFLYPTVDEALCVECRLCEKICPVKNGDSKTKELPQAYAAYNKDAKVRLDSSSGGIFTLMAEYVLNRGGVVAGAAFDSSLKVTHICVESKEELARLRGSKYVQSRIGNVYKTVSEYLNAGKMVLFTGTPCQTEGLRAYLQRNYENLVCADFVCHGVPSPMVWEKYVAHREAKAGAQTRKAYFRHKEHGLKRRSMRFEFANQKKYEQIISEDLFMRSFLSDLCLRPSCYACKFKTVNRASDITLADFWGIENILPEMDDDKGTSLCIVHSEKGREIFRALESNMECRQVELDGAVKYNSAMIRPAALPKARAGFMKDIASGEFDRVAKKYNETAVSRLLKKVKRKIIRIFR